MANYYVATTGSNTSPYDTWAKAATNPRTITAYIQASGGANNTVYIAAGDYTDADLQITHANHVNTAFIGTSKNTVSIKARNGQSSVNAGAGITGCSYSDITFKASDGINIYDLSGASTYNDCDFIDNPSETTNAHMVFVSNAGGTLWTFNRCRFFYANDGSGKNPVYCNNGGTMVFNNCISMAAPHFSTSSPWYIVNATVNINNCIILDSETHGIWVAGGTVVVKNSFVNSSRVDLPGYGIYRGGGSLTVTNTMPLSGIYTTSANVQGTYTNGGGNNLTNPNPYFHTYPRKGYILLCIDDALNFAYAQQVESVLSLYGFKATFFPDQLGWSAANNASLITMVENGVMELGCHSYSHTAINSTGKIFDVTKGAETITIDRTAGTITLSGGGSVTGFKTKTLAQIKTALEALTATVTPVAAYNSTILSNALGEIVNDGVAVNEIDILRDVTGTTGLEKAEMADPKAYWETLMAGVIDGQTGIAYVCNSFGCPFDTCDADNRTSAINLGYTSLRSGNYAVGKVYAPAIDVYQIYALTITDIVGDGTEATVRKNTRALAINAANTGLCISILAHTAVGCTIEQWGWICNELSKFGNSINVTSQQLFRQALDTGGWTVVGDGTYTRSYTISDGNYHPQPGSALLRSGIAVSGITTDFDGNPVPLAGGYNIGPYNNQFTGGGLSPGLGLSGGHRPPWWNRRRR